MKAPVKWDRTPPGWAENPEPEICDEDDGEKHSPEGRNPQRPEQTRHFRPGCIKLISSSNVILKDHNIISDSQKTNKEMVAKISLTGLLIMLFSCNQAQNKPAMSTVPLYKAGFIKNDKIKLHYLDWGGSGQPLILLHGLGDSPYLFEGITESLQSNFRIIACSKRGHGYTESIDSIYDTSTLVADLKILLDSLGIEKASLLGWSMGAMKFPNLQFAILKELIN